MRGLSPARPCDAAAAADTLLHLAVLLEAGLAPVRAWEQLSRAGDPAARRVCAALEDGTPLAVSIARAGDAPGEGRTPRDHDGGVSAAWRDIAAAWRVATSVGAPLADSLREVAASLRDAHAARDEVRVALAEPAGTARLMSWLPLVGVVLGLALGFDTIGVLVASPVGAACLVSGGALVVAARWWSARLVRGARRAMVIPGIAAEVLAIALSAGASVDRARRLMVEATGAPPDEAADRVLALSRSAGVPAAELLRASASLERHRARTDARLRAARLSTRLLLPLGVCTLPAFLLLGVAPMLLGVMSAVPLSL